MKLVFLNGRREEFPDVVFGYQILAWSGRDAAYTLQRNKKGTYPYEHDDIDPLQAIEIEEDDSFYCIPLARY